MSSVHHQSLPLADVADSRAAATRIDANRRLVRSWLAIVLFTLFSLVLVGGATRLTESGLSITEWKPIHGALPPLSVAEWEEEFALYKQIPQYQQLNKGMSLEEFKTIFWWEWGHRLLARSIGVIFALPLLVFWVTGRIERRIRLPLVGLLALGGFQGFIGWWMVSSGLADRVSVSQYRLAVHLTIACSIFAATVWIMRGLTPQAVDPAASPARHRMAAVIGCFALFQIYLGALVAGLDAGLTYNTWPLMDGAIIPGDLFIQQPWWINLFENVKTVQFVHRLGGYTLFALALIHMIAALRTAPGSIHTRRAVILFCLVTLQAALGITTLLLEVPIGWALAHQGGALVVLGFAVAHWRGFVGEYPRPGAMTAG